ncbi:hypothetical protein [Chryseobacterium gossypii]|uniref:hypothetical protein n=1 Tax=Chryseobacterium gossypii TaxID=3231602 RepID=UPI0035233DC5
MDRNKYLQKVFEKGLHYGPIIKQYFIEEYKSFPISSLLKSSIEKKISGNENFEINVTELQEILPTLDRRIEELLKHPDFNPFKEELRQQFPEQYGSQPFEFKGTTYYLYHKGREFYVDGLIYGALGFKKLIEDHIAANKPLRYVYKE